MGFKCTKLPNISKGQAYFLRSNGSWSARFAHKLISPPVIATESHGDIVPPLEILRLRKHISGGNTLVHFDAHHDLYDQFMCMYYSRPPKNMDEATKTCARKNNFPFTLLSTGMTGDIVWVVPEFIGMTDNIRRMNGNFSIVEQGRAEGIVKHLSSCFVRAIKTDELLQGSDVQVSRNFNMTAKLFKDALSFFPKADARVIIDIDLDWFGTKEYIDPFDFKLNGIRFMANPNYHWDYDYINQMDILILDGKTEKKLESSMIYGYDAIMQETDYKASDLQNLSEMEFVGVRRLISLAQKYRTYELQQQDPLLQFKRGYTEVPDPVFKAFIDAIAYFKNIQAICISQERDEYSLSEPDMVDRIVQELARRGIIAGLQNETDNTSEEDN